MRTNKLFVIVGRILAIVVGGYLLIGILPWLILCVGLMLMPNPPKPEIRYGEFPFKLTYELDGEIKTIEDIAVCEFDGYSERTEAGWHRKWKTYLKSEEDGLEIQNGEEPLTDVRQIPLLDLRNEKVFDKYGHKVLELYFYGGNGHYYMGDKLGNRDRKAQDLTAVGYMYERADGEIWHGSIKAEEVLEKYHIRLISWEAAPPITNRFKGIFSWFWD